MRLCLGAAVACAIAAFASGPVFAAYPEKLIRILVSAPPGTAPDIVIRLLQPKMAETLGQSIVVENKAGANGSLAAGEVGRAAADGYTLLVTVAGTMTANPFLYPKTAALAVADLMPVTQIATVDFVIAAKTQLGIKTLPDLLTRMRAEPGKMTLVTTAHGSFPHLAAEMLKQKTKLDFTIVKVTGGAAAGNTIAGGHADAVIETAAVLEPMLQGNLIVPLASTGAARNPKSPSLPTVIESGLDNFTISGWIAVAAPRETPLDVRETVQRAVAKALTDPAIRDRLSTMHFVPVGSSPQAFDTLLAKERDAMRQIVKEAGLATE